MLADYLRLVEGPLIGRPLLGQQHLLHGVVAAEGGHGQDNGVDRRDDGDSPGEGIFPMFVPLLGIGDLDLGHRPGGLRSLRARDQSPRASRPDRPRKRTTAGASAPRSTRGPSRKGRPLATASRRRPPAPCGTGRSRARRAAPASPGHSWAPSGWRRRRRRRRRERTNPDSPLRRCLALLTCRVLLANYRPRLRLLRNTSRPLFTPTATLAYWPTRVRVPTATISFETLMVTSSARRTTTLIRLSSALAPLDRSFSSPVRDSSWPTMGRISRSMTWSTLSARRAVFLSAIRTETSTALSTKKQSTMTDSARGVIGFGVSGVRGVKSIDRRIE